MAKKVWYGERIQIFAIMYVTFERIRKELGISQKIMAEIAGVSRPTWANVEAGRYSTPGKRIMALIPYQELLTDKETGSPDASGVLDKFHAHVEKWSANELAMLRHDLVRSEKELATMQENWQRIRAIIGRIEGRLAHPSYKAIPQDMLRFLRSRQVDLAEEFSPHRQLMLQLTISSLQAKIILLENRHSGSGSSGEKR